MQIADVSYTVHVFKEGPTYIAHALELDVSSCGDTDQEARKNIRDAVRGLLETSAEMGTLDEILLEAGYQRLRVKSRRGSGKSPDHSG